MEIYIGKIFSPFNKGQSIDLARLSLSNERIELEFSCGSTQHQSISQIFGIFNGLGKVTLIDCKNIKMSSGAGTELLVYSAEYLFNGEFINDPFSKSFSKVNIIMPSLLDWTKLNSIENNVWTENKISIKDKITKEIYNSDKFSIELFTSNSVKTQKIHNKISITENVGLTIESNENINVWEFLNISRQIKKMLHILGNIDTHIESYIFDAKNEPTFLYCQDNLSLGKPSTLTPKIKFSDVEMNFDKIIYNWFNNLDIQTSIDLILEKTTNNHLSRENYFLNNCFSIETFHRQFKNYKLFKPAEFKIVKNKILSAIDDKDISLLVRNNLAHLNQPNFKNRLIDFNDDFIQLLPEDFESEQYIRKIVKTRNYLVHRGSDKNTFDRFDILYCAIYLEALIKINIFRVLEINEAAINKSLNEISKRIEGFYKANKRRLKNH